MTKTTEWIRNENNKTMRWLQAHPIKACAFTAFMSIWATIGIMWPNGWHLEHYLWFMGVMVVSYGIGSWNYLSDIKKLTAAAVVVATTMAPMARAQELPEPPIEEHPALVIGVGVVIGVGAWAWWKMNKCSEKAAKGRTNGWPEELNFNFAGNPGEWGAAFSWAEIGYCHQEQVQSKTPTVFTLDIEVKSVSNATITATADVGEKYTQTFDEAVAELYEHGLTIVDREGTHESYEINRQPAFREQVPASFNFETKTLTLGHGGILVTVDRSTDLQHWNSVAKFNVPQGQHLTIPDVSEERATFWRVTTKELHD